MTSEEIIAQNCHCRRLRSAARATTRIYDEAIRSTGIKSNQLTILVAVSRMQPVPISQLANQLSMERTTMTRNLLPLEKEGFIQIEAGTGRIRNVSITQKGTNIIKQAKPLWDKAQAKMEDHLSKKALSTLANTLKQIASLSP